MNTFKSNLLQLLVFAGIIPTLQQSQQFNFENATHIVWSTGGNMVPATDMSEYIQHGANLMSH